MAVNCSVDKRSHFFLFGFVWVIYCWPRAWLNIIYDQYTVTVIIIIRSVSSFSKNFEFLQQLDLKFSEAFFWTALRLLRCLNFKIVFERSSLSYYVTKKPRIQAYPFYYLPTAGKYAGETNTIGSQRSIWMNKKMPPDFNKVGFRRACGLDHHLPGYKRSDPSSTTWGQKI